MQQPETNGFLQWLLAPWKDSRPFRIALLLILFVSVGFRIFLISQSTWQRVSDSRDYHEFAESLIRGEGYRQVYTGETSIYHGLTFYAYRMPGYPIFLATVYCLFGPYPQVAMAANLAAEVLSHLFLLAIAYHLFGRATALWSQALWAIHIFWTTSLMTESLFTAGFLFLTALLVYGAPFRSKAAMLAYGSVACAITFLRPIGVVVYLPLGVLMLATRIPFPRKVLLMLIAVLPTAFCLFLWTHRNHRILGKNVYLTSQSGRVNAKEFGVHFELVYRVMKKQGANEAQIDQVLKEMITRRIRANPYLYPRVYLDRLHKLLVPQGPQDLRLLHLETLFSGPRNSPWVLPLARKLYYQYHAVYLLAAVGLLVMIGRRTRYREILAVLACFILFHPAVSKTYIRYAAPIFPILILCAAYALASFGILAGRLRPGKKELTHHRAD